MAYISQDAKKQIAADLKAAFPKLRFSLSVRHSSTLVVSLVSGDLDIVGQLITINSDPDLYIASREVKASRLNKLTKGFALEVRENHIEQDRMGEVGKTLSKIFDIINQRGKAGANFDDSDTQTDYFHVGYYVDLIIGKKNDENNYNGVGYIKK